MYGDGHIMTIISKNLSSDKELTGQNMGHTPNTLQAIWNDALEASGLPEHPHRIEGEVLVDFRPYDTTNLRKVLDDIDATLEELEVAITRNPGGFRRIILINNGKMH